MVLQVVLGRFLDTSLIQADVQPTFVRLLIKGCLLQLVLPSEVRPDASWAQRSRASGRLVLTMPKAVGGERQGTHIVRPRCSGTQNRSPCRTAPGAGQPAACSQKQQGCRAGARGQNSKGPLA